MNNEQPSPSIQAKNMATITEEQYKEYIASIMERLIKEKQIMVVQSKREDGQIVFKIVVTPVEWFTELDDDTKYNVTINLQEHFKPIIIDALKEYRFETLEENTDAPETKRARTE
jgi:hypothetical protein